MKIIFHTPVGKFESEDFPEDQYKEVLYMQSDNILVLHSGKQAFTFTKEVAANSVMEVVND